MLHSLSGDRQFFMDGKRAGAQALFDVYVCARVQAKPSLTRLLQGSCNSQIFQIQMNAARNKDSKTDYSFLRLLKHISQGNNGFFNTAHTKLKTIHTKC